MISHEKARLASGSTYEIVPGGLQEDTDRNKLTTITLLRDRTLSEVDSEIEMAENIATVTILDASGEEMDIKKGYKYQTECKKQKNYVVGRKVADKSDLNEDAVAEYKDMTATVMIIGLTTGDIQTKLDEAKTQISKLNATADALLVTNLEE